MAAEVNNPQTPVLTTVEKDPQWTTSKFRIYSINSHINNGLMQIQNGNVTCTGSTSANETLFKVYVGGTDNMDVMFECIGGDSCNWMVCVDSNHELSAKKRTHKYINFNDAGPEVVFALEIPSNSSSHYRFKWKKGDTFMAFKENGQPMPLQKVAKSKDEALFNLIPA